MLPPPGVVCGPAVVDGDISEWDLDNEFFANMYRAGNASKPVESRIYVRFDPATDTLYLLIMAVPGVEVLAMPDDAFVKLGGVKLVDGNSGNNGVPADFAWVGLNGDRAQGWEASMPFVQGTYSNFNVHTQVWDDGEAQTSAVKNRAIGMTIECEVIVPLIDVEVTVTPDMTHQGDLVTWAIVVTNIGSAPLTNVTLTDSNGYHYGAAFNLAVDESQAFTYTSNPEEDLTNTVTATGTDSFGETATDTDSAAVDVIFPAIGVLVWGTPETIHSGAQVTWDVIVVNTGDDPLTDVTLTDSNGHSYGAPFDLTVGENRMFSYTTHPTEDVTNIVTATGMDSLGADVTDTDSASVNVIASAIDVEITVTPETVYGGEQVTWDVIVTNTSDEPLTNVALTDSNGHNYGAAFALAAGESQTFSYPSNPAADVTNTVTATGMDPLGEAATDTDSASVNVIAPAMDVEITVTPEVVYSSNPVTWEVVVINLGDDPLIDVTLTDSNGHTYGAAFDLTVGESLTFSYTSNPTATVTNTVTATGTDSLGGVVSDTDSAAVSVIAPVIDVEIAVSPATIRQGDQVTWTILVTNTGSDPLTHVRLTDTNGHHYGGVFRLDVDESQVFTYTSNSTADVTNVVTATGRDPFHADVMDTDSASVNVINPAIGVEITVAPETVHSGEPVTWEIVVTNMGDDPLTGVSLTDSNGHSYGGDFSLAVGAGRTFQYTSTPTLDLTNTVTVTGRDSLNGSVADTDSATVSVINPAIDVEITVTPGTIYQGDPVTWAVVATNTGDTPLTNVTLTDSNGHSYGAPFDLAVDASMTFNYISNPAADVMNTVTAMGTDSLGSAVSDTDSATVNVINPAIDVSIAVTAAVIRLGDQVTWTVVVTNTGDDPLTEVTLTDTNGHNYGVPFDLAVGASQIFSYVSSPTADVLNTVAATGTDALDAPVTDTDGAAVNVMAPAIEIMKEWFLQGEIPVLYQGGEAFFDILVTNTGDVPLTDVTVADALTPDCNHTVGTLAVGEAASYSCSLVDVQASFTNVAVATGTDPLGGPISDEGEAYVEVTPHNPEIRILKDLLVSEGQTLYVGDDAVFYITVQNTGDMRLYGVMVTDPLANDCNRAFNSLMVGESTSYTCIAYGVTESFTNTAIAEGHDVTGDIVTDIDDAGVIVTPFSPSIEIIKRVDAPVGTVFRPGDDIPFVIIVTNNGNVFLDTIVVLDALVPDCNQYVGSLTVGESVSYGCEAGDVEENFVNIATAMGSDARGGTVTDTDAAAVELDEGGIPDQIVIIVDTDGDGVPDYIDVDIDGDGIPNDEEGQGDTDGDGMPDYQDMDTDGDGLPDAEEGQGDTDGDGVPDYQDVDADGDGIPDAQEGSGDTDGDGVPDYLDTDADDDGITDEVEGVGDVDGDGAPNYLDNDSDGDGIPDAIEGAGDADGDGIPDFIDLDADDDGIPDATEGAGDTDGDGIPNYLDTDSDSDGIPDEVEGAGDTDGDGIANHLDGDSDGDGISDAVEGAGDADGDGVSNYLDSDSDGDGISDNTEGVGDSDGDGISNYLDLDADGDGIQDALEGAADVDGDGAGNYLDEDSDGDGIPDAIEGVVDTDGDGAGNYLDLDSDSDGILDAAEGVADSDGDGLGNYVDLDSDGDGIPDAVENIGDANADGQPDRDADGDGIPNYLDLDSDADGVLDAIEGTGDVDADGIPNYLDADDNVTGATDRPFKVYLPLVGQ